MFMSPQCAHIQEDSGRVNRETNELIPYGIDCTTVLEKTDIEGMASNVRELLSTVNTELSDVIALHGCTADAISNNRSHEGTIPNRCCDDSANIAVCENCAVRIDCVLEVCDNCDDSCVVSENAIAPNNPERDRKCVEFM